MNRRHARWPGHQYGRGRSSVPRPLLRYVLAVSAAMTAVAVVLPALPAAAADGIGGPGEFGIAPAPDMDGHVAPYFQITLAPGHSFAGTAILRNQGNKLDKLRISQSTGTTAVNGGSAFSRSFHRCAGTGCWLTHLPRTVTLAANSQQRLHFIVRVPAGTSPGQYLAGISVEAAKPPRPVVVGSNGKASARAIIVDEVTVGVAVTVGSLPQLRTHLHITGVSAVAIGRIARLNISLANTGQTFAHGQGTASCSVAGKRPSAPFFAGTVLPHQQAVIAANAAGVPEGTSVPCRIRIVYGTGQVASWSGSVTVPDPPEDPDRPHWGRCLLGRPRRQNSCLGDCADRRRRPGRGRPGAALGAAHAGAPPPVGLLTAVSELCGRLGVVKGIDMRSVRLSSGIAVPAPGSCWPGSRRRGTIDLDATDVEACGRRKRGVAYNHQGQRVGRPHVAAWAGPRSCWPLTWAPGPLTRGQAGRSCRAGRWLPCRSGSGPGAAPWRVDAGYSPGRWPAPLTTSTSSSRSARGESRRCGGCLRHQRGRLTRGDRDGNVQVAVADYRPDWWPASTWLLIRRVRLASEQVSADPRSRRHRTLHPGQRALPIAGLAEAGALHGYSFILTNLNVSAPDKAAAVERWHRHRTTIEKHLP